MLLISLMGLLAEVIITSPNKKTLGICFWIFQFCITLLISYYYCYRGFVGKTVVDSAGKESLIPVTGAKVLQKAFSRQTWRLRNVYFNRIIYPLGSISLDIGLGYFWFMSEWKISAYLLNLLICYMSWTLVHYILMKFIHGEFSITSWTWPIFYFGLSGGFAHFAMGYFTHIATKWEVSPAESRGFNQECVNMFGMEAYPYDNHDVWHFLSATAIFFLFNVGFYLFFYWFLLQKYRNQFCEI